MLLGAVKSEKDYFSVSVVIPSKQSITIFNLWKVFEYYSQVYDNSKSIYREKARNRL
ncbi:21333_t:CDS:1, partial [Gigaspora rosea]